MKSIRLTVIALIFACGMMTGCGALDTPSATVVGVNIDDFGLQSLTLKFDIKVTNPNSVRLPLLNMDYALASDGQSFLSGEAKLQGFVPAGGDRVVPLYAKVTYLEVLGVLKKFKLGAVIPYQSEMGLSVDAPIMGKLRLPLKKSGRIPIPAIPSVEMTEIKWDKVTLSHAGGKIRLKLTNRCAFPVKLKDIGFNLVLAETNIGRCGTTDEVDCAPNSPQMVDIGIGISPSDLGLAAFRMLRGKGAGYKINGAMKMGTEFGPLDVPLEKIGKTLFK